MTHKARALMEGFAAGNAKFGLVCGMPSFHTIELLAGSGYDFFLIDAEHQATDPAIVHSQLLALSASNTAAIIKLPSSNDATAVRQYLDLGIDGLMAPCIENAEQAEAFVRLTRYPPRGVRGIAGAVRATNYTRNKNYVPNAERSFCRIALIETRTGLQNLEKICAVDGIDIVFFGPSDLSADLGHLGQPQHPENVAALEDGVRRVRKAGKVPGLLAGEADIAKYRNLGASMFIAGAESVIFVQAADGLAKRLNEKFGT